MTGCSLTAAEFSVDLRVMGNTGLIFIPQFAVRHVEGSASGPGRARLGCPLPSRLRTSSRKRVAFMSKSAARFRPPLRLGRMLGKWVRWATSRLRKLVGVASVAGVRRVDCGAHRRPGYFRPMSSKSDACWSLGCAVGYLSRHAVISEMYLATQARQTPAPAAGPPGLAQAASAPRSQAVAAFCAPVKQLSKAVLIWS
jgi:hypothetical protein